MGFFAQLVERVADEESHPISSCLLQAKILASKLRGRKFRQWVDQELDGYSSPEDIPDYRWISPPLYGDFAGHFGSQMRNVRLSTDGLPSEIRLKVETIRLPQNVGTLEGMLSSPTDYFERQWEISLVELLRRSSGVRIDGMILNSATSCIPKSSIRGLLHSIRKRLLDFLIELSEHFPELDQKEDAAGVIPPDDSNRIFDRIVIHAGHDISVNGDLGVSGSMQSSFNGNGLSVVPTAIESMLNELKTAVNQMCAHLSHEEAANARQDLNALTQEIFNPSPRKRWLELTATGLKDSARIVSPADDRVPALVEKLVTSCTT